MNTPSFRITLQTGQTRVATSLTGVNETGPAVRLQAPGWIVPEDYLAEAIAGIDIVLADAEPAAPSAPLDIHGGAGAVSEP